MNKFTAEFIKAQRELAAKATPQPWRTWDSERGFIGIANNEAVDLGTASRADDVCIISEEVNDHHCAEDATYIVTAANNYPAALDEIERLRGEVAHLQELVTHAEGKTLTVFELNKNTINRLKAEIERLREALQAERNWINTTLRNHLSAASLELNMHIREWSEEAEGK